MLDSTVFRHEIAKLALALDAAPGQTVPSSERLELLYEDVRHLDAVTFALACDRCRKELEWFPKAKHILERAQQVARASGAVLDGAGAWAAFESRVLGRYSFGVTKTFDWPDDLTRTIVREQLGFDSAAVHNLAMIDNDIQRDKYRKRFIALYDEQRGLSEAQAAAVLAAGDVLRLGRGE
jgi:hypothetical protein